MVELDISRERFFSSSRYWLDVHLPLSHKHRLYEEEKVDVSKIYPNQQLLYMQASGRGKEKAKIESMK